MAKCPNCGGTRFEYQLRSGGTEVNSKYYRRMNRNSRSWIIPAGEKDMKINRRDKVIGFCPDCGYMTGRSGSQKTRSEPKWILAGVAILILFMFGAIVSNRNKTASEYVWAHEVTPLDQFEYMIDGRSIHLGKYIGKSKQVYIGLEYNVDGESMPVVDINCHFHSITSCIIPDGTAKINNSMFNGSSVKYLYIPVSLTDFKGWSYFNDLEYLYYGGTEDQFKEFHKSGNVSNIVSKRIYYNASIEDIIKQDNEKHPTPQPTEQTK